MNNENIGMTLTVLLATTLIIFSGLTIVFSTNSTALQGKTLTDNGPPVDPPGPGQGPPDDIIPDPGNMRRRIGSFTGSKSGSFVSFETIDNGIKDHELKYIENLTLFERISVENLTVFEENSYGPRYILEGNGAEMEIFDNPSALIKIDARPLGSQRNITFRFGNMTVEETGLQRIVFGFEDSNRTASLTLVNPSEMKRDEIGDIDIEEGHINYTLKEKARFVFNIEGGDFEESESFSKAFEEGKIGGQFRVESANGEVRQMAVSYRDVNMIGEMKNERTWEMMVSSETLGEEGTVLNIDISSSVMDIESAKDMNLKFDGEDAFLAEDFSDLKNSLQPAYLIMVGEESTQLLVRVPEFSTHSITVEHLSRISEEYLGSLVYYLPSAVLSIGLVLFGILYRRDHGKKNEKDEKEDMKEKVAIGADPENYNRNKENERKIKGKEKESEDETHIEKY